MTALPALLDRQVGDRGQLVRGAQVVVQDRLVAEDGHADVAADVLREGDCLC